jgi:hypothetical protein
LRHLAARAGLADSLAADFQHLDRFLGTLREAAYVKEQEFIRRSLEGELAASLFGSRGRIESSFESDEPIQCALKVLSDRAEYARLLSAPAK